MPWLFPTEFEIMQLFWQKGVKEATLNEIAILMVGYDNKNPYTRYRYLKILLPLVNAGFLDIEKKHDFVFSAACTRRYYVDHFKWWKRVDWANREAPDLSVIFWWLVEHLKRKPPEESLPPDQNPSA